MKQHTTRSLHHPVNHSLGRPVVIDATDQILGRLAVRVANILRGKDKPIFAPHLVSGEKVVVVNAEKIRVTGRKLKQKVYYRHSGWPGGLKARTLEERLRTEPEKVIVDAVWGMLPRNRLRKRWLKRLTVVKGEPSERPPRSTAVKSGGNQDEGLD